MTSDEMIYEWINRYLRRDDIAFDVGANQGLHTKHMLDVVGREGKVVAFEPVPENLARLNDIESKNKALIVEPLAVGDQIGKKQFNVDARLGIGAVASSFHKLSGLDEVREIEVRITTLDDYIKKYPDLIPKFLKIDVEGYELNVFFGAAQLIADYRPICIFEMWESWFPKVRPIFEFLKPGYRLIRGEGEADAYDFYSNHEGNGVTDILCLPTYTAELNHQAFRCLS